MDTAQVEIEVEMDRELLEKLRVLAEREGISVEEYIGGIVGEFFRGEKPSPSGGASAGIT